MKRVGGQVTWLCEFDRERADLAERGFKQQTLRRCHIVEAGDTLRLSTGGAEGVFAEVTVRRSRPIVIGIQGDGPVGQCWADLDGKPMTKTEFESLARADGFENALQLVNWLDEHNKFFAALYEGQLIEW